MWECAACGTSWPGWPPLPSAGRGTYAVHCPAFWHCAAHSAFPEYPASISRCFRNLGARLPTFDASSTAQAAAPFSSSSPDFMGPQECCRFHEACLEFFHVASVGRGDSVVSCHPVICPPGHPFQWPLFSRRSMMFERCLSLDARDTTPPWISSYLSAHSCLIDSSSSQCCILGLLSLDQWLSAGCLCPPGDAW